MMLLLCYITGESYDRSEEHELEDEVEHDAEGGIDTERSHHRERTRKSSHKRREITTM